jgi:predicted Fe-S protein YdhL (DUF1289 family)
MKKYLTILIAVVVLLAAYPIFGQREGRTTGRRGGGAGMFLLTPEQREKWRDMSEEERAKLRDEMREKWQNMSEEERGKVMAQMRQRFAGRGRRLGREDQLKAIEAVQEQVAKLKKGIQAQSTERRSFRDMSEEERNKLREEFMKARQERNEAMQAIVKQISRLQGQGEPAEGEQLIIINTGQLRPIHELAVKEKARETAQSLERLMRRGGGGFGRPARQRTDRDAPRETTERPGSERRSNRQQRER